MAMKPGELSHNVTCVMLTYQLVTYATYWYLFTSVYMHNIWV